MNLGSKQTTYINEEGLFVRKTKTEIELRLKMMFVVIHSLYVGYPFWIWQINEQKCIYTWHLLIFVSKSSFAVPFLVQKDLFCFSYRNFSTWPRSKHKAGYFYAAEIFLKGFSPSSIWLWHFVTQRTVLCVLTVC